MYGALAAAATVLAVAVACFLGFRARAGRVASRGGSGAAVDGELVAVIAAAIAAATGEDPDSFRVVGVSPSGSGQEGAAPAFAGRILRRSSAPVPGLNTPAWGHVDRFPQGE